MKNRGYFRIVICLLLLLSVVICASATSVSDVYGMAAQNGCYSADAQFALLGSESLVKNVRSGFIYEHQSKTLMYSYNPDASEEPASLVKIMTALIAIENGDLTEKVTVKQAVLDQIPKGMVSAGLVADEVLTLEDLLYLLMLKSANDAAVVIAEGLGGSVEDFALMMNEKARKIGAVNSNFSNPHGLPDDNHYTTAKDLAIIAAYAMRNEVFATIVNTKTYKTGYHALTVANSNKLLYQYAYILLVLFSLHVSVQLPFRPSFLLRSDRYG